MNSSFSVESDKVVFHDHRTIGHGQVNTGAFIPGDGRLIASRSDVVSVDARLIAVFDIDPMIFVVGDDVSPDRVGMGLFIDVNSILIGMFVTVCIGANEIVLDLIEFGPFSQNFYTTSTVVEYHIGKKAVFVSHFIMIGFVGDTQPDFRVIGNRIIGDDGILDTLTGQ